VPPFARLAGRGRFIPNRRVPPFVSEKAHVVMLVFLSGFAVGLVVGVLIGITAVALWVNLPS